MLVTLILLTFAAFRPEPAVAYRVLCAQKGIGCIAGTGYDAGSYWSNPVDPTGNNCTNYAAYRLHRRGVMNPGSLLDAFNWAPRAREVGVRVNRRPARGSIAQWGKGRFAPTWGHVAYVERVRPRFILLTDSNYFGGSKRWRVSRRDWQWPARFIHFQE